MWVCWDAWWGTLMLNTSCVFMLAGPYGSLNALHSPSSKHYFLSLQHRGLVDHAVSQAGLSSCLRPSPAHTQHCFTSSLQKLSQPDSDQPALSHWHSLSQPEFLQPVRVAAQLPHIIAVFVTVAVATICGIFVVRFEISLL